MEIEAEKKQESQNSGQQQQDQPFLGINGEQTGLGFATRDVGAKTQEDQGILEFVIIRNDGTRESMKLLIDLKNIFSRQLPKMPKDYIVKLVFDKNHEAMIIMKNKQKIIGGICYRNYPTQKFAEIAFLAITNQEQVKGYGTRLMTKFKNHMQSKGVEYLMTYADNLAIDYFKKQGFSKEIRMPQERWKGFIKDYDGGTLMECYIHPSIDYQNISNIIKQQRQFVIEQTKKLCINNLEYPGFDFSKILNKEKVEGKPLVDPLLIPGISISGWVLEDYEELSKAKERSFQLKCQNVIDKLVQHRSSWPFREPVKKEDVPDYYEHITDPIDLQMIQQRLNQQQYQDKDTFVNDIKKMFKNCKSYNQPETVYYKCSMELENYISVYLNQIKDYKQSNENNGGGKLRKKNPNPPQTSSKKGAQKN